MSKNSDNSRLLGPNPKPAQWPPSGPVSSVGQTQPTLKPPPPSSLDVPGRPQGSIFNRMQETMDASLERIEAAGGLTAQQWATTPELMEFNAKRAARGSIDHFCKIVRFSKYLKYADNPDRRRIVEIAKAAVAHVRPLFDRPNIAECGNCGARLPGFNPAKKKQKLWNPYTQVIQICFPCNALPVLQVLEPKPEVKPDVQAPQHPHP